MGSPARQMRSRGRLVSRGLRGHIMIILLDDRIAYQSEGS